MAKQRQVCADFGEAGASFLPNVSPSTDLAGVVMDNEALVPAVEVLVCVDLHPELLQHGLVGSLAHGVHGGAHVVQDAHDTRRTLRSQRKLVISDVFQQNVSIFYVFGINLCLKSYKS